MGAIFFFDSSTYGKLSGSSFAEPDGTEHAVELLEGRGKMILRVELEGEEEPVDLLFTRDQAIGFKHAVDGVMSRIGLNPQQ